MPSLALAGRSMRLDARSPLIHILRFGLGALMFLALLYVWLTRESVGAAGLNLYTAVIRIDFFFVSVLGVAVFATCITEERREGSLGLMRMAGIRPIGVLIGKSINQLTVALSLLAVQLPFTLFSVSLGGVSNHQIFAGFVLLGCYLLFAYGVGLLASTLFQTGPAASRVTAAILLLASLWPVLWKLIHSLGVSVGWLATGSTPRSLEGLTVWEALETTTRTGFQADLFGVAAQLHLGLFGVLFLLAWLLFDRVERRAGRESTERSWLRFEQWGETGRVPRFSGNALVWKDYRLFVGGRQGMLIRFGLYGLGTLVLAWIDNPLGPAFSRHNFGENLMLLLLAGVVLDLGSLAGRVFREEIGWQTYSTLLLLPKSVLQISYGKIMGCLIAVVPALCFLMLGLVCTDAQTLLMMGPILACIVAMLYVLLPLIAYVSLWLPRGAFPLTLFGVLVIGTGIYTALLQSPTLLALLGIVLFLAAWRIGTNLHERILTKLGELSGVDV